MTTILLNKLHKKYAHNPPKFITNRFMREIKLIRTNELVKAMLVFAQLDDLECPYYLGMESAASFSAYLLGFSSSNPLPPHYYCPDCHRVERTDGAWDGFDLPDMTCSVCSGTMRGDGHDFHFGYLYGSGPSMLLVKVPEKRYYEVLDYLSHFFGSLASQNEPFFPERYAQFGMIGLSSDEMLPPKCANWNNTPSSAQIKRHAISICKNSIYEKKSTTRHILDSCGRIDTFYGAVRCYGIAAAAWKSPIKSAILLAEKPLPNSAIMREDVYDYFRSIGCDEKESFRQMKRFYYGRGTVTTGRTPEETEFLKQCGEYSYIPSRICAVEYYIAKTKLALNGSE